VDLEGYNFTAGKVAALAYANDLCFITATLEQLQEMLNQAQEFADWTASSLWH